MNFLTEDTNYCGLDIGATGARVVQLRRASGNPALVTFADIALPPGLTASDSSIDQDKLATLLKQLMNEAKVDTKNVVAGVPSAQAFSTVITTPKLSSNELSKAMKLQADQYIPMAVDQVRMDWQILGPGKTDLEMQVLLVAAPNSIINKYVTILQKAGLELAALEINAVALTRSLMPKQDLAVLILDVGSLATDLAIVHQGAPKLIRSVPSGGSIYVRAAAQTLGLEEEQASQFIQKFGLTNTKLEGQVLKALKPALDLLTEEIDKSIKFFTTQNPTAKMEKIILTGGTAAMPEFTSYLSNATGLPTEVGNPWRGISYPAALQERLNSVGRQYATAVGLAARSYI